MLHTKARKTVSQLIKPFPGRWVALLSADDSHVVCVASSAQAVLNKARRQGESRPHFRLKPLTAQWPLLSFELHHRTISQDSNTRPGQHPSQNDLCSYFKNLFIL